MNDPDPSGILTASIVYQQESLKIGYAERLYQYGGKLMFWHINNHRLAIADRSGDIYVRELRSNLVRHQRMNVSGIHPDLKATDIAGLWMLEDGDILIQTCATGDTTSASSPTSPTRSNPVAKSGLLTRLRPTVSGLVIWRLCDQSSLCGTECAHDNSRGDGDARPIYAVGKTEIYEMRHERHYKSPSFRWVSTLIVRRLDQPYQRYTMQRYWHSGYFNDCHITLTGDDKFLILKNRKGVVGIISTANGDFQNIRGNSQASLKVATSCIVVTSSSEFCEYRSRQRSTPGEFICAMTRYDYDVPSASFVRKLIYKKQKPSSTMYEIHDCDRGMTFLVRRRRIGQSMSVGIHKTTDYQSDYGDISPDFARFTTIDPIDGQRSVLRLPVCKKLPDLPLTDSQKSGPAFCSESFMGMMDGYFINYDSSRGQLLILSFWPSW